jgi:transmembrane sensor
MSGERPLATHLSDAFDRGELASGFERVERRIARRKVVRRGAALLGASAVAAGALLLLWPPASQHERALTHADGAPLGAFPAGVHALSDGSQVAVEDGALAVVSNTSSDILLELGDGRARFDIRPGGLRRWSVRAGPVTVFVLGTSFTVVRAGPVARVEVHRGVVSVTTRAESRLLHAGERFEVGRSEPEAAGTRTTSAARTAVAPVERPEREADRAEGAETVVAPPSSPVRARASEPEPPAAQADAPAEPVAAEEPLPTLVEHADRARREQRPAEAISALRAIIERHPSSSEAPSAAVTLAQLELDRGDAPAAITAYRHALSMRLPPALAELCYERLVHAHLAARDRAAAEQVAAEYRGRFPHGSRTRSIEALLGPP